MNEKVVYINVNGYIKEWLINRFGNPVRFPKRSFENEILARYIISMPRLFDKEEVHKNNLMAVQVPSIHGKPWESHNYFTIDGRKMLRAAIRNLFELDMLGSVMPKLAKGDIYRTIDSFCKARGISTTARGAVIKRFYRIRREYEDNGIELICRK